MANSFFYEILRVVTYTDSKFTLGTIVLIAVLYCFVNYRKLKSFKEIVLKSGHTKVVIKGLILIAYLFITGSTLESVEVNTNILIAFLITNLLALAVVFVFIREQTEGASREIEYSNGEDTTPGIY